MDKQVIILGGTGDGIVIASFIKDTPNIKLLGFLNDGNDEIILGFPVLGRLEDVINYFDNENIFFITALLKTKYSDQRSKLIENLNIPEEKYCNIIHPSASISHYSSLGVGNLIGPHVTIMPGVTIGNHCSFRASASIGHDSVIDSYCYMGPNSTLAGRSTLKKGAHIGPNASVLTDVIINKHAVVGMGSVIVKDVGEFNVMFGVPAKKISRSFQCS